MNKYFVKIPYSYSQYATLSGYVYAEDEEEANDIAMDREHIHEEDYEDDDDSGDSNYDFENIDVECVESDVHENPFRIGICAKCVIYIISVIRNRLFTGTEPEQLQ